MQIKIEIDNESKEIKKFEIPQQINPIQAMSIMTECTRYMLSKLEVKPKEESKIIKPKLLIKGNGGQL